eukprot:TCONS_00016861-protein
MRIYTAPKPNIRGGFILCFMDNGCGMDPIEVSQVVQFGRSSKREAGANHIGQYGNGLKSGSMRIGKDMILFTKKGDTMSCLFLSRTFHEKEDIHEVIVPMPSWNSKTKEPYLGDGQTIEKHNLEVEIITKYSPFKSQDEVFAEFEKIPANAGTNVMIYNMKLMDNGLPELDIKKDEKDILMADPHSAEVYDIDENIQPEKMSFRNYCSILYCEPNMKIYIQDQKILTRKMVYSLYKPKSYTFTSTRFKKRSEIEAEIAERLAKDAEEKAKELMTQSREVNATNVITTKEGKQAITKAGAKADEAKVDADFKRKLAEAKRKSAKEPKTLTFTFGFNINKRNCDGLFIYNCNRLIRMYEKVGGQMQGGNNRCSGIVGIVDVPYLVLEPTHNKQDFADQKEYKHLLRSMSDHMLQYWKDSKIESQGITKFWDDFGYGSSWKDDPSDEAKFKMKRLSSTVQLAQCNDCLKWRQLTFSRKMINYVVPPAWVCSNNTDIALSSCKKPEQKITIQTGKLTKEIKNLNDKRADEVRKLEEKLNQKKSEIKKNRRARSPSPVREPTPPPVAKRGRRQKSPSPSPSPPKKKAPVRKAKSPSPPPPRVQRKKARSPSPPTSKKKANKVVSPAPKRKAKSPSPPPQPAKSRKKARSPSPPLARLKQRKAKSPSPEPEPAVLSRPKRTTVKPDPPKAPEPSKTKLKPVPKKTEAEKAPIKIRQVEEEANKADTEEEEELTSTKYPQSCKVEAKMNKSWYNGTVVAYKKGGAEGSIRVRVKFEKHSHDKFDKWFFETDPMLRLREPESEEVSNNVDHEDTAVNKADYQDPTGELLEKTTYLLRRCLCYFRAPDFEKDKREILALTPQQLKDFPLNMFFDDYERNIKKQLQASRENFIKKADETEQKLRECETEKNRIEKDLKEVKTLSNKTSKTLKDLRLDVNVMLRNILNEDEKLDFSDASENVDIYLRTIVEQINDESKK